MKLKKAQVDPLYSAAKPAILIVTLIILTLAVLMISFTKSKGESYLYALDNNAIGEYYAQLFYSCLIDSTNSALIKIKDVKSNKLLDCISKSKLYSLNVCYSIVTLRGLNSKREDIGECNLAKGNRDLPQYSFSILLEDENGKIGRGKVEVYWNWE